MPFALILHNIRSTHNVGAILRTAEGFGITRCYITGYTPYPKLPADSRLPHLSAKIDKAISKTALGSEALVPISQYDDVTSCIEDVERLGYTLIGLEQDKRSIQLDEYKRPESIALLLGEEVAGITEELRDKCQTLLEIPMRGQKESFNVSVAAGIAMYELSRNH